MTRNEQIREAANQQNQVSVDWLQVRIQAAIEMMKTLHSDKDYKIFSHIQIARISVEYADALVKELKGE